jgi:hypothetical protein
MASMMNIRDKLIFKGNERLKLTLTIAMLGFLIDTIMTRWMLSSQSRFYESNTMLNLEIGLPLMVLSYVVFDLLIPRKIIFDNVFYALSILQWSGPVQNLLVLLNVTRGFNFFYALPFILVFNFVVLNYKINRSPISSLKNG